MGTTQETGAMLVLRDMGEITALCDIDYIIVFVRKMAKNHVGKRAVQML